MHLGSLARACLIWVWLLSRGQDEAPPGWMPGGASPVLTRSGVDEGFRVSVDGDVSLIFAGWLPQDGAFGSERHACLASSVAAGQDGCS